MAEYQIDSKQQILTPLQISQKITRMAYEIYEQNFEEESIIVAGITGEGFEFAKRLTDSIESISPIKVRLIKLEFDIHARRQTAIDYGKDPLDFENQVIVVGDVVLNTGRTMTFALQPFLQVPIKKLQVAVVVDRAHRTYPVSADYVGYSLSTTFSDHIQVILSKPEIEGAYL